MLNQVKGYGIPSIKIFAVILDTKFDAQIELSIAGKHVRLQVLNTMHNLFRSPYKQNKIKNRHIKSNFQINLAYQLYYFSSKILI